MAPAAAATSIQQRKPEVRTGRKLIGKSARLGCGALRDNECYAIITAQRSGRQWRAVGEIFRHTAPPASVDAVDGWYGIVAAIKVGLIYGRAMVALRSVSGRGEKCARFACLLLLSSRDSNYREISGNRLPAVPSVLADRQRALWREKKKCFLFFFGEIFNLVFNYTLMTLNKKE